MLSQNRIDELEEIPLTGKQVLHICGGNSKIVKSTDLHMYKDIDDLLFPYGAICLLYMTSPNYGHWTCLFRRNNKTLEFFDSYGYAPDEQLKHISKKFKNKNGMIHPILSKMLFNSKYKVIYNNLKLQKKNKDTSTCGYYVGSRIALRSKTLKQYINLLKKLDDDLDEAVVQLVAIE